MNPLEVGTTIEMGGAILVRLPNNGLYDGHIEFQRVSLD